MGEPLGQKAAAWLRDVADMLEKKAEAYGDSAGNPMRVFSKSSSREQLLVRADDKLSRLTRGTAAGEDAVKDLVGYLALLAADGWQGGQEHLAAQMQVHKPMPTCGITDCLMCPRP